MLISIFRHLKICKNLALHALQDHALFVKERWYSRASKMEYSRLTNSFECLEILEWKGPALGNYSNGIRYRASM